MNTPNRRYFLAAATAALSRPAAAAPSATVRVGMIGMGGRGNAIMTSELKNVPNSKLTHLCDVDQAHLEKA